MASTYISRSVSSTGNRKTWTLSFWVKKSRIRGSGSENLFSANDGTNFSTLYFEDDAIHYYDYVSGNVNDIKTNRKFRDPGAWYHIVFRYDSTQAASGDRIRIYVNGVEETSFATESQPSLNYDSFVNNSGDTNYIGTQDVSGGADFFDGTMSHIQLVDGTSLAPTVFGETDATDGMWKINTSPTVTYGTNGFFLKMEDSSNMDLDSSGNGLTFTTSGTLTSTKDNPSNNFCTLNPLYGKVGVTYAFTNGNNVLSTSGGSGWHQAMGTLGASSGKWYYEAYANYAPGAYNTQLGWGSADFLALTKADGAIGSGATKPSFGLYDVGQLNYSTDSATAQETASWGAAWTSGDYLMFAADLDNGRFYYGKNGTWDTTSSSNPVAGTGGYSFTPGGHTYIPMMSLYYQDIITNFGNGYFTTTSAGATNADDNGNGVFKYDVPAGFYAICTKNIKEFG
jgi:hypothetical protein